MVRLKHDNDEKSTTGGREFHTFITLSAYIFAVRAWNKYIVTSALR